MTLVRWEPFNELRRMEDALDRMWGGFFRPTRYLRLRDEEWALPLDIYQTEDSVVVKAPVHGIRPEDVEVTIDGNTLTVRGESKASEEVKEEDYILREQRHGTFCRSVTLPAGLDTHKAEATYEDGVLTLAIPRREEARPRSITVKVAKAVEGKKE